MKHIRRGLLFPVLLAALAGPGLTGCETQGASGYADEPMDRPRGESGGEQAPMSDSGGATTQQGRAESGAWIEEDGEATGE